MRDDVNQDTSLCVASDWKLVGSVLKTTEREHHLTGLLKGLHWSVACWLS